MINMFRMYQIFLIAQLVRRFFAFTMTLMRMLSSSFMDFINKFIFQTSEILFIAAVFKICEGCRLPIIIISTMMTIENYTAFSMTFRIKNTNTITFSKFMDGCFTLFFVVSLSVFECSCKNLLTFFLLFKHLFILIYFI